MIMVLAALDSANRLLTILLHLSSTYTIKLARFSQCLFLTLHITLTQSKRNREIILQVAKCFPVLGWMMNMKIEHVNFQLFLSGTVYDLMRFVPSETRVSPVP